MKYLAYSSIIIVIAAAVYLLVFFKLPEPPPPIVFPEAQSPAAMLYVSRCSACHAAPSPEIHSAKEWPVVLERMKFRMTAKAIPPLSDTEMQEVTAYLQKYAKAGAE